ncbi:hypothetical protein K438DRAFT_1976121 [Mycena galopus ATCC 62051]|nr:hypothetical protein K438DRAFT_1976121 [Mycena galopus ATCC 62051]
MSSATRCDVPVFQDPDSPRHVPKYYLVTGLNVAHPGAYSSWQSGQAQYRGVSGATIKGYPPSEWQQLEAAWHAGCDHGEHNHGRTPTPTTPATSHAPTRTLTRQGTSARAGRATEQSGVATRVPPAATSNWFLLKAAAPLPSLHPDTSHLRADWRMLCATPALARSSTNTPPPATIITHCSTGVSIQCLPFATL